MTAMDCTLHRWDSLPSYSLRDKSYRDLKSKIEYIRLCTAHIGCNQVKKSELWADVVQTRAYNMDVEG